MVFMRMAVLLACIVFPVLAVANPFDKKKDVTAEQINEVLGMELFSETPLWEEDETEVAKRLKWPEESRTTELASYRRYAVTRVSPDSDDNEDEGDDEEESDKPTQDSPFVFKPIPVAGRSAYSAAYYAMDGQPEMISIVFSNKGDARSWKQLEDEMEEDETAIESGLTDLLGKARRDSFGKREFRERVTRWDWNGTAILLTAQDKNYVGLRVVPIEVADKAGIGKVINDSEMKALLAERIERRDNGDVVLQEIPMVDQGPKGYCAPATWERYLRYLKIPADMYVLAMAGNTQLGGGTYAGALNESVDNLAQSYKRRVKNLRDDVEMREVKRQIDKGLPIIWSCAVDSEWDNLIYKRMMKRKEITDMKEWSELIEPFRENAARARGGYGTGHMRMIIGYNEETGEVAISDSWGKKAAERWITEEEAQAMSTKRLSVIQY